MAQHFKDTSLMLWVFYQRVQKGEANAEAIGHWISLGQETLDKANVLAASSDLVVADKQKLQAAMSLICSVLVLLRRHLSDVPHASGDGLPAAIPSTSNSNGDAAAAMPDDDDEINNWDDVKSAFENRIRTGVITNSKHLDAQKFFKSARQQFIQQVNKSLKVHAAVKVNTVLAAEYVIVKDGEETADIKYFNTKSISIYSTTDLKKWFTMNVVNPIDTSMEEFQEQESGWSLRCIINLTVNINKLNPMRGSSYIKLPDYIERKRACINVVNKQDNECFKWAILSRIHSSTLSNPCRRSSYEPFRDTLNFKGIEFPVEPRYIEKFEEQNVVSVNLYFLKRKGNIFEVSPLHLTSCKKETHANLLFVENDYVDENKEEEEVQQFVNVIRNFHYVWIKDLSKLVRSQLTARRNRIHLCDRCFHYFHTEEKLAAHTRDCEKMNKCKIILPQEKDSVLTFTNFDHQNQVPFVVYADFECLLQPVENDKRFCQRHEAYSVGYFVKCRFDDRKSQYQSYRQESEEDEPPAKWFVRHLHSLALQLQEMYKNPQPMKDLTAREKLDYSNALVCHICNTAFTEKNKKVRDHCHFTGNYRGPAHNSCNVNYQDSRTVPVIFHNLSGYDSHLFIKEIASCFPGRVHLIPQTKERYISFTKFVEGTDINLRFIDSFKFMASSLDKLSSYLEKLDTVERVFQQQDGFTMEQINLLKRKGVFPYDYVSSFDRLRGVDCPSKEDFFNSLYNTHVSDEDYEHAQNVWQTFNIQNLGEYSDLYLKTDVLLLAEVFENFRDNCLKTYGLDPAHYYTTPGLAWDAMLKYTQVQLELLTDIDMLMFIERGIRGGISQCCNRYAKANNPYMKEGYDPAEPDKYLMYYDVNNLYGWAMTESLPMCDFKWVERLDQYFFKVPDDNPYGYFLEVDLEYPESLHDAHRDLPFCAEHIVPPGSKEKKLMTTLHNKERYVIHYRALKQALQHGLRLIKIHRALRFRQCRWLKSYIDLNSEMRKNAKNEFEKMLYKLFNNAVYGKTMENERKRVDVKLVNKWSGRYGAEALIARPHFHSCDIFDENLVAVQLFRSEIHIRKPIYIGLTVLDLSKTLVYRFHYDYMRDRVGDQSKLMYTDTDSLVYEVTNVNMYDVMRQDIQEFDTSDYPQNNPFNMPQANKKIVGLMKDECNGEIMLEFVGLRSKMYSALIQNEKPIKKAKGVKSSVVKATISFDDYVKCLREKDDLKREQRNIRSRHHQLHTEKETKVALSAHDDKRYLLADQTDTLPWGHYSLKEVEVELLAQPRRKVKVARRPMGEDNVVVGVDQPMREDNVVVVGADQPRREVVGSEVVVGRALYQQAPEQRPVSLSKVAQPAVQPVQAVAAQIAAAAAEPVQEKFVVNRGEGYINFYRRADEPQEITLLEPRKRELLDKRFVKRLRVLETQESPQNKKFKVI